MTFTYCKQSISKPSHPDWAKRSTLNQLIYPKLLSKCCTNKISIEIITCQLISQLQPRGLQHLTLIMLLEALVRLDCSCLHFSHWSSTVSWSTRSASITTIHVRILLTKRFCAGLQFSLDQNVAQFPPKNQNIDKRKSIYGLAKAKIGQVDNFLLSGYFSHLTYVLNLIKGSTIVNYDSKIPHIMTQEP